MRLINDSPPGIEVNDPVFGYISVLSGLSANRNFDVIFAITSGFPVIRPEPISIGRSNETEDCVLGLSSGNRADDEGVNGLVTDRVQNSD